MEIHHSQSHASVRWLQGVCTNTKTCVVVQELIQLDATNDTYARDVDIPTVLRACWRSRKGGHEWHMFGLAYTALLHMPECAGTPCEATYGRVMCSVQRSAHARDEACG